MLFPFLPTGLLIDLVKDRCQLCASTPASAASQTSSRHWTIECARSNDQTESKFPLLHFFKSSEALQLKAQPNAADDRSLSEEEVKSMVLEDDAESSTAFADGERVDNTFISLQLGTSRLRASLAQEMHPAAPYMLPGSSPFWSPLLLERFVHAPLAEFAKKGTATEVSASMIS